MIQRSGQLDKLFDGLGNLPGSSTTMDPISIFSTIGTVGTVANSVCTLVINLCIFIEGTKNINQAVSALVDEVNGLNAALEAVKLGLQSDVVKLAETRANSDASRLLWASIQGSLNDCQATIDKLEKAVVDVRPEGKNFAQQAFRQIKLNLMDSEITTFRSQIKTHTNALQMALQMINLRAACLVPGAVTDELGLKIDKLREIMELVYGSEADLKSKSLGVEPKYLMGLRMSAQKVISSATTVSANSEANGSCLGDMDEEKRQNTLIWVSQPVAEDGHGELRISPPPSDDYSGSHTIGCDTSNDLMIDSESEEDLQSEKVQISFSLGKEKFDGGNFAEAQLYFQKCLELAEGLPLKRREPARIVESKLMIATCIYHSVNFSDAERILIPIIEEKIHENITDEGAKRRCQASHLLAGILLRQEKYSLAKSFCKRALLGRRRVLGKDHISYYESLGLLSQIYEASGEQVDAGVLWAMIPEEVASTIVKVINQKPPELQIPMTPPSPQGGSSPTFSSSPKDEILTQSDEAEGSVRRRSSIFRSLLPKRRPSSKLLTASPPPVKAPPNKRLEPENKMNEPFGWPGLA